jgi:hypothetical protein
MRETVHAHSEREYGEFYRSIPLPEGVVTESAQASFNNGVLEVSMQAPPAETRGRRLEIKEGGRPSRLFRGVRAAQLVLLLISRQGNDMFLEMQNE